ncbi:molybdopterin-guanine dinucleotide biosynthesis protein B [Pallidibacillus thermolactis subsp. kokeshiiformis]|uniref:molybdopterin-guanine dinucleotide biosynthesis protein B n=1 Tax=Pallidibacillus thermolactis TaxID=251051 RepID=UPI0035E56FBE
MVTLVQIFQIIGYKNSGKTTLTCQFIKELSKRNLRVASLKHHGHGGLPLGIQNTDSEKHRQAGSIISGVIGEHILQLSTDNWQLTQLIKIYEIMHIDVLILEGFKHEDFPKIVLISDERDLRLLHQLTNVQAVLSTLPQNLNEVDAVIFQKNNTTELIQWYCNLLGY